MRVPSAPALLARVYVDCTGGLQYYTCVNSGFAGCCSVDACDFSNGCPDSEPATASVTGTSTLPSAQTSTITTAKTITRARTSTSTAHTPETSTQSSTTSSLASTTSSTLIPASEPTTTATTATTAALSSASPSPTSSIIQAKPSHPSGGALAGIVVGSVLAAALLLAALVLWSRRRRRRQRQPKPQHMSAQSQEQQPQGALQAPLLASPPPPSPGEKSERVVSELLGTPVTPELSAGLFEDGNRNSSFAVSPVSPADSRRARATPLRQPRQDSGPGPGPGPDFPRATLQLREQELSQGLHVASWEVYQP